MPKHLADTSSGSPVLEVTNLRYIYPQPRAVVALDGVTLSVHRGEYVAVVGENGSGKTTLCRCISTYLRPQSGSVRINAQDPFRLPIRVRSRLVGYVFQNPDHQLFRNSVWDDIRFGLEAIGEQRDAADRAAKAMLEEVGLAGRVDTHPFVLSRGERQRLAIAVLAVMRPTVLIIDEPTTGLDSVRSHEVMKLLQRIREDWGTTIIVVTHNMELVAEYCGRVVVMGNGHVILDDEPRVVFAQQEVLSQTHLEAPALTQVCARLGFEPAVLNVEEAVSRLVASVGR